MTSHHYLHTGQDASFAVGTSWPEPRFDLRDDEVIDRLTGLNWCRNANLAEFPFTWQDALDFVATMNREKRFGRRDWRMPNRRELRRLLSLQGCQTVRRASSASSLRH